MAQRKPMPGGYGDAMSSLGAKGGKISPEVLAKLLAMLKAQQGGRPQMPMGGGPMMMGGR